MLCRYCLFLVAAIRSGLQADPHDEAFGPIRNLSVADPLHPTEKPVPYIGIQCVVIPAFPTIGNQVGQLIAAALVGSISVDEALHKAQLATERVLHRTGTPQ